MNGEATTGQVLRAKLLLDMSGSMMGRKDDTVKAVNEYLGALRTEAPDTLIGVDVFNRPGARNSMRDLLAIGPAALVRDVDGAMYQPSGSTPLYDAIAWSIERLEEDFVRRPEPRNGEAPRRVILPDGAEAAPGDPGQAGLLVIQTDGQENCSEKWTKAQIITLVSKKQEQGWQFIYLGCDLDAMGAGSAIGVRAANTMSYDDGSARKAYRSLASATTSFSAAARAGTPLRSMAAFGKSQDLRGAGDTPADSLADRIARGMGPVNLRRSTGTSRKYMR